jgi:hypothetical protein
MKIKIIIPMFALLFVSLTSPIHAENPEHVKKLKQTKKCSECDLSGVYLSNLN